MPILLLFFKFWFWEAPLSMLHYFGSLNNAFLQLFSLPLFIKTFFKPLKNEYRRGLVWFSIGMGMVVKSALITVDLLLLVLLLCLETACIAVFVCIPFGAFVLLMVR